MMLSNRVLSSAQEEFFEQNGYLVLEQFFDERQVEIINSAVEDVWNDPSIYNSLTISAFSGTSGYKETYLRQIDRSARDYSYKLNHLYLYRPDILRLLGLPRFTEILSQLLDGLPLLFNGLNMEKGTEQRFHFDTFYMPPTVPNKMVATWIALEDIHPDSGPLQYYPGSHLIEPYVFSHGHLWAIESEMPAFDQYIERKIVERRLQPVEICPRKGDLFIWHAQLYHGGSPIADRSRSRRSMVNHFWRSEDYPGGQQIVVADNLAIQKPAFMCVAPVFAAM